MPPFKADDLLTRAEAAEYLRLSVSTLANAASANSGPEVTIIGERTVRYRKAHLDEWVAASTARRESSKAQVRKAAMAGIKAAQADASESTREVMINGLQALLDTLKSRK